MITPRPKTRLDDAAPVLFRLPNLRTRGSRPKASESMAAVLPNVPAQTVAAVPQSSEPLPGTQASTQSLRIDREFDVTEIGLAARSQASESPRLPGSASPAATNQSNVTGDAGAMVQPVSIDPLGRSWMERVGSRMILIVTLLVIVSAAWVTGTRVPASKPGNHSNEQVAQTLDLNAGTVQLPEISTGQPEAEFGDESKSQTEAMLAGSDKVPTKSDSLAEPDLSAPMNQLEPSDSGKQISGATRGSQSVDNLTQLLPPSGQAPESAPTSDGSKKPQSDVVTNLNQSFALKPPAEQEPLAGLESSFYTADDNRASSSSIPVSNVSIQTRTPVAPTIDPAVLVPWADQNSVTRTHQPSATPNPISDWSQYLPGMAPSSNVRTTSATQSPTDPSAQQAIYQPNTAPTATTK